MILKQNLNNVFAGIFVTAIGVILLLSKFGMAFPAWLFTWPIILISIGTYIMIKSRFKSGFGFILSLIGLIFLSEYFYLEFRVIDFIWPIVLILGGISLIFNSQIKKDKWMNKKCRNHNFNNSNSY